MLREIKFRAWHHEWSPQKAEDRRGINGMQFVDGWWYSNKGYQHVKMAEWSNSDPIVGKDVALMQFTGLHDKNGEEIWEGDILTQSPTLPPRVVTWKEAYSFTGFNLGSPHNRRLPIEVIGNIWEHPELLS